ncbi:hypothetical protein PINS_up007223 [Pythium insidiosum]|nr:hypothetical protein PINS_up007223 [Pythium insidiosum]
MTEATTPLVEKLDLGFLDEQDSHVDAQDGADAWVDTLVALNRRWLGSYARVNPTFSVHPSLLERNSLWMNTFFQKQRVITSPLSKQGMQVCRDVCVWHSYPSHSSSCQPKLC